MTKRFTTKNIICSNYCVWDNNDKPYGNDEVVELLNELHEENMEIKCKSQIVYERDAYKKLYDELKQKNEELKYNYNEKCNEYIGLEEQVDFLLNENEQLKQHKDAVLNCDSSKIIRVNRNTGEVDLIDKEHSDES